MNATAIDATACHHRNRCVREQDAAPIESSGVDRIIAHAVARDHAQPPTFAFELRVRHLGSANQQRLVVGEGSRRELAALNRDGFPRETCVGKERERGAGPNIGRPVVSKRSEPRADFCRCLAHTLAP